MKNTDFERTGEIMGKRKNDASPEKKRFTRHTRIWIALMVMVVLLLLMITMGIIGLRVGNVLPDNTDIVFIVGKRPSVDVGDGESRKWVSGKNINIFSNAYANKDGVSTVVSQDGTKVIAPGTQSTYRFTMYNDGNMAVRYQIDSRFVLTIGGKRQEEYRFPLLVRLKNSNGDYLLGKDEDWIELQNAAITSHLNVLGASSYENFTLDLLWQFDGEDDELDTWLGDASASVDVTLTFEIRTYAEEHSDPSAKGGIPVQTKDNKEEYGGQIRWLYLAILILNVVVLIFYVLWLLKKRLKENKDKN